MANSKLSDEDKFKKELLGKISKEINGNNEDIWQVTPEAETFLTGNYSS